jgi:hypothetical protein
MLVEGTVITGELPKMRAKSILIQGEIAGTPWRACLPQLAFFNKHWPKSSTSRAPGS